MRYLSEEEQFVIMHIDTANGCLIYVCDSEETARVQLKNYVKFWWEKTMMEPLPEPLMNEDVEAYLIEEMESVRIITVGTILGKDDPLSLGLPLK